MKYVIGIDLGISSCGWSIIDHNTHEVIKTGVALFTESSDAADRRVARSARRIKSRRLHRIERLAILLNSFGIPTTKTIDPDLIYKRKKGLTEKIDISDIVNIIYYFGKHRGYIPFDLDNKDKERETYIFKDNEYPCDYYIDCLLKYGKYRDNECSVALEDNIRELRKLLTTQSRFYSSLNEKLAADIISIIKSKREFYVGPGGFRLDQLSKYGRIRNRHEFYDAKENPDKYKFLYERLIGKCKVAIHENKAPSLNYFAEKFNFLNDFINLRVININLMDEDKINNVNLSGRLTYETINKIEAYILSNKSVSFKSIAKLIGTQEDNLTGYRTNKDRKTIVFSKFENYKYVLNKFVENNLDTAWITSTDKIIYNKVIYTLTVVPSSENIEETLSYKVSERTFTPEEIDVLKQIKRLKKTDLQYHSLSEKVLLRSIEDMKQAEYQLNYMQISVLNKYSEEFNQNIRDNYTKKTTSPFQIETKDIDDLIANPQVKKSLRKAIKVINAIIVEQGRYPEIIAIESTREMNGNERKRQIINEQSKNEKNRKNASNFLCQNGYEQDITETTITKTMCYLEANHSCIYCNMPVNLSEYLRTELEHILPISKSFDDSFDNITCSCTKCNKEKGNKSPYQYLTHKNLYNDFKERVLRLKLSEKKTRNLLFEGDLDKETGRFINRNLRDTAYGTQALIDEVRKFNIFLGYKGFSKINVVSIPGQATSKVRKRIGLDDKDRTNPLHHAVDATIVASIANTPKLGRLLIDLQNNARFWHENKGAIIPFESLIKKVELTNLADIKKIKLGYDQPDYNSTHYDSDNYIIKRSYEVDRDPSKGISHANIVKVITKEEQTYLVKSVRNIYEVDFTSEANKKRFDEFFNENSETYVLLCYHEDKKTYNLLKEIYTKYKNEKGNPFVNYCLYMHGLENEPKKFNYLIHGIKKWSKKDNGPIVKTLRYTVKTNNPYYIEKKKVNNKKNIHNEFVVPGKKATTKIALDKLAQIRTDIYYDIDNKKFVFLPINVISIGLDGKAINTEDRLYKEQHARYIGNKYVTFIGSVYNGNWVEFTKKDGTIFEGIYKGFHKNSNALEFYINGIKDPKLIKQFNSSDSRIVIYNANILGKRYKTVDSSDTL